MEFIRALINFFYPSKPRAGASQCGYGSRVGAEEKCVQIVQPGSGFRRAGRVFCSEEHARRDVEEAIM